jgi:hypothetical protein
LAILYTEGACGKRIDRCPAVPLQKPAKTKKTGKKTSNFVQVINFTVLSILIRIQNHRGKPLTGKTGVKEKYLKA